jgi:hypothetical protein
MWTPEAQRYPGLPSDKQVLTAIISLMRRLAQNFSSSNQPRPKCGMEHDIGAICLSFYFRYKFVTIFPIYIWWLDFGVHTLSHYNILQHTLQMQMLLNAVFLEIHPLCSQQSWFIIIIRLGTVPFGKLLLSNICTTDSKQRVNKFFIMETFPVMSQQISTNDPIFTCNFKILWTVWYSS